MSIMQIGSALGWMLAKSAIHTAPSIAKYAGAASSANGVSWASQQAQGAFNQNSANIANDIATQRLIQQYQFNSAQAAQANQWTQDFWNMQAAYNSEEAQKSRDFSEYMWNKQAAYNAAEAQKARDWQAEMDATKYTRATADMKAAGINPILAAGGIASSFGSGPVASVSGANSAQASAGMGSGQMASGGTLNGISASEGNFTGQMDYYSGLFNLIGSVMGGLSSAFSGLGSLGDFGKGLGEELAKIFSTDTNTNGKSKTTFDSINDFVQDFKKLGAKETGDGLWQWYKDQQRRYYWGYKNGRTTHGSTGKF